MYGGKQVLIPLRRLLQEPFLSIRRDTTLLLQQHEKFPGHERQRVKLSSCFGHQPPLGRFIEGDEFHTRDLIPPEATAFVSISPANAIFFDRDVPRHDLPNSNGQESSSRSNE